MAAPLIDRRGGIQLWRQIADRIAHAISAGEFGEGAMLPPEVRLAQRYGVNRHTVRAALAVLSREGIVQPLQGKGTLVLRRERLTYPIARRTRFSQGLAGQVGSVSFISRKSGTVAIPEEIAEALQLDKGTVCVTLETLGSADGLPLSLANHVFAPRLERLPALFTQTGSITEALASLGIPDYIRLSTTVTGRLATAEDLAALSLSPGAILLETVSVNGLPDGTPFQFSRTLFPADRIKLSLQTE